MKNVIRNSILITIIWTITAFAKGGGAWDFEGYGEFYETLTELVYDAARVNTNGQTCNQNELSTFIQSFQDEYAQLKEVLDKQLADTENPYLLPNEKACLKTALEQVK